MPEIVGIDFDNTLVSYDAVFRSIAAERLGGVPGLETRVAVRDYLHRTGQEDLWLKIQRAAYGRRITEATAFPGLAEFLAACRRQGVGVRIVSHKSSGSVDGDGIDLRAAALSWLAEGGYFEAGSGLTPSDVHFEETRAAKLARIRTLACTYFVDDLTEVLEDPSFPADVARILFDPAGLHRRAATYAVARTWHEVGPLVGVDVPHRQ